MTIGRSCASGAVGGRVTAKCQTNAHGWQMIAEKFRAVLKQDCIKSVVEFAGMLMWGAKIKDKTRDEHK